MSSPDSGLSSSDTEIEDEANQPKQSGVSDTKRRKLDTNEMSASHSRALTPEPKHNSKADCHSKDNSSEDKEPKAGTSGENKEPKAGTSAEDNEPIAGTSKSNMEDNDSKSMANKQKYDGGHRKPQSDSDSDEGEAQRFEPHPHAYTSTESDSDMAANPHAYTSTESDSDFAEQNAILDYVIRDNIEIERRMMQNDRNRQLLLVNRENRLVNDTSSGIDAEQSQSEEPNPNKNEESDSQKKEES